MGSSLSGTPAEAGVRAQITEGLSDFAGVSVEPLPKQGCEFFGARDSEEWRRSLSGTPAEAGVRAEQVEMLDGAWQVSVEPLPKQGCEPRTL